MVVVACCIQHTTTNIFLVFAHAHMRAEATCTLFLSAQAIRCVLCVLLAQMIVAVCPALDSRSSITRDVLLAFCFSIAALVFAVVAVSFIHPYRKCEDSVYVE